MAGCIENELNYLLRGHAGIERILGGMVPFQWLQAGYLSAEARVRMEGYPGHEHGVFTYKKRISSGRNIEINRDLDAATFNLLMSECAERVHKRRYTLQDGAVQWDVDFFTKADGEVYIVKAEAEMPPDMEVPERVHPVLLPHVAFAVPRDDNRFSSRKLADEAYARKLAEDYGAGS